MGNKNLKQVVEIITGHGHWLKYVQRMEIIAGTPTCRRCGEQMETAKHLLFDCTLAQVSFTTFGLVSKNGGFLQENITVCILRYCRLMDLLAVLK